MDPAIYCIRTVFKTTCKSSLLIDLRDQSKKNSFFISKDCYEKTQNLGAMISTEGFPGLIIPSARKPSGTNLAIFAKKILSEPEHQGNYIYKINPESPTEVNVMEYETKQLLTLL